MAEETNVTVTENNDPAIETKTEPAAPPAEPQPLDFDAAIKDPDFKKRLDSYTRQSNENAIRTALQKQQRAHDESLTRAERLQAMSDAEKVKFLEEENKKLQDKWARDKEIESLKTQTAGMLNESKIPAVFLDVFDFEGATAEDIKQRVGMLSEYEYYQKGELTRLVSEGINDKLKQKTTETHVPKQEDNDLFLQGFNSNYRKIKKE